MVINKKIAPDKDDMEKKSTKHHECVVCIRFKVLHGTKDVQETLIGLLDRCLKTLHEQDKTTIILIRNKTVKARQVSKLPHDFTNFYVDWGIWDEDITMF